jgi:hypothetical protein
MWLDNVVKVNDILKQETNIFVKHFKNYTLSFNIFYLGKGSASLSLTSVLASKSKFFFKSGWFHSTPSSSTLTTIPLPEDRKNQKDWL